MTWLIVQKHCIVKTIILFLKIIAAITLNTNETGYLNYMYIYIQKSNF